MARPPMPARGDLNWDTTVVAGIYDVSDRVDLVGSSSVVSLGVAPLESFTGASDDAKLAAAMSYAGAQSHPPAIVLTNRSYSFSAPITPYNGMRLVGPLLGRSNAELADANKICRVSLSTNGTWIPLPSGGVQDVFIGGIAFNGATNTVFMGSAAAGYTLKSSQMRDLSFSNFSSVFGTQALPMRILACTFNGTWGINGTFHGGMHLAGSDSRLFTEGCFIDSPTSYNATGGSAGQFLLWLDSCDFCYVGPIYITNEGNWGGIKVSGPAYNSGAPSNEGMIAMHGVVMGGRNAGAPCNGAVLRVEGGVVRVRDAYIGRGMASPASMGHSPADAGVVHVTGGALLLDGTCWDKYSGQSETTPMVYQSGGVVRVANSLFVAGGGAWSALPLATSVGGSLIVDDTMRTA